ncbi:MAG TPA: c-type cytochrome [Candidatus Polarisedimenticolaceae bacterium]|nr:c-type cytochrome [Candidatus Polarisedimenticolaceae bacterium]
MRPIHTRAVVRCSVLACLLIAGARDAGAQIPDEYTNLTVVPKEITKSELVGLMREVASSLGVRCAYCHVGPDDLQGMDFASDEKAVKRTARTMMKMVDEINGRHLKAIETGRAETTRVRCVTCHRGLTVPKPIQEILDAEIEANGVGAALAKYRELREQHFGSAAYDFSQGPLNWIVEKLAREQRLDDALAIAAANVELNPTEAYARLLLGRLHVMRDEREQAIAAFREALELDPENAWAKTQLEELTAAGDEQE